MHDATPSTTLRERVLSLTYACPKDNYRAHCPFGIMRGLSHESRTNLLAKMEDDRLLQLFGLVAECRCPADPRSASAAS